MAFLGIDPGTSRWAFVFLEGGKIIKETAIPTEEVKKGTGAVVKLASQAKLCVAPSGYGTMLKRVADLSDGDFSEILLKLPGDNAKAVGLEAVLRAFKEKKINAYVLPGVKLLPTVSAAKKRERVDMGTPDKVCAAAAGIVDQAKRLGLHYSETSFILAEIGTGFDAFIAVEGGRIIDGIGGTMSSSTWRGGDGELLYLEGKLSKDILRKGDLGPGKVREGAQKDVKKLQDESGFKEAPREILVSGSKSGQVLGFLKAKLKELGVKDVRLLKTCESSNAAYGAAVIADGLSGGRFKGVVDLLKIKEAKGGNLDYTRLAGSLSK